MSDNLIVTTRQITGQPYRWYGYVYDRVEKKYHSCCSRTHNRRKGISGQIYAERCAGRLLRKMRRTK